MALTNIALYRTLVKLGAEDVEAQAAATVDAELLATKADLAELKADLTRTIWQAMLTMAAIFTAINAALRFVK